MVAEKDSLLKRLRACQRNKEESDIALAAASSRADLVAGDVLALEALQMQLHRMLERSGVVEQAVTEETVRRRQAEIDLLEATRCETESCGDLRGQCDQVHEAKAKLHINIKQVANDTQKLTDMLVHEEQAVNQQQASELGEHAMFESHVASLFKEVDLAHKECDDFALDTAALAFEASRLADRRLQALSPDRGFRCGAAASLESLRQTHVRLDTRLRGIGRAHEELEHELKAARGMYEGYEEKEEESSVVARSLRDEIEEAQRASNYMRGLATRVLSDDSATGGVEAQQTLVRKGQEQTTRDLAAESASLQTETASIENAARDASVAIQQRLQSMYDAVARLVEVRETLSGELQSQRRRNNALVEAGGAAEECLRGELRAEREKVLQMLPGMRQQATLLSKGCTEALRELDEERLRLGGCCQAGEAQRVQLQTKVEGQRKEAQDRAADLRTGFERLEHAHSTTHSKLLAERAELRARTEEHGRREAQLRSELTTVSLQLGGLTPATLHRLLHDQSTELKQTLELEHVHEQRTAQLAHEVDLAKVRVQEQDAASQQHLATLQSEDAAAQEHLRLQVQRLHSAGLAAEMAAGQEKREALRQELQLVRDAHGEAREVSQAEAAFSKAQADDLLLELDALQQAKERATSEHEVEMVRLRHEILEAEAARQGMASGLEAHGAAQAQHELQRRVVQQHPDATRHHEATYLLGQSRCKHARSLLESVIEPHCQDLRAERELHLQEAADQAVRVTELQQSLNDSHAEQSAADMRLVSEMRRAAAVAERLEDTLRVQLTVLHNISEEHTKAATSLRDEAHSWRSSATKREVQASLAQRSLEDGTAEEHDLRFLHREVEASIEHEMEHMRRMSDLHSEECERTQHLTGLVMTHSEVLAPARETELHAVRAAGREAEAAFLSEILSERQAIRAACAELDAASEATARVQAACETSGGTGQQLQQQADSLARRMAFLVSEYSKAELDLRTELTNIAEATGQEDSMARHEIERRQLDIQHLQQLSISLEREVDRRVGERSAAWRGELVSITAEDAERKKEHSTLLATIQENCSLLRETLTTLEAQAPKHTAEVAAMRKALSIRSQDMLGERSTLLQELHAAKSAALEESAALHLRLERHPLELASCEAERERRAIAGREAEALRALGAEVASAETDGARAREHRQAETAGEAQLRAEHEQHKLAIPEEQATELILGKQLRASHEAMEATSRTVTEQAALQRERAAVELGELRGALAHLRAHARAEVASALDSERQVHQVATEELIERLSVSGRKAARWRSAADVAKLSLSNHAAKAADYEIGAEQQVENMQAQHLEFLHAARSAEASAQEEYLELQATFRAKTETIQAGTLASRRRAAGHAQSLEVTALSRAQEAEERALDDNGADEDLDVKDSSIDVSKRILFHELGGLSKELERWIPRSAGRTPLTASGAGHHEVAWPRLHEHLRQTWVAALKSVHEAHSSIVDGVAGLERSLLERSGQCASELELLRHSTAGLAADESQHLPFSDAERSKLFEQLRRGREQLASEDVALRLSKARWRQERGEAEAVAAAERKAKEEWQGEKVVLSSVLASWEAGVTSAQMDVLEVEDREAQLEQSIAEARRQANEEERRVERQLQEQALTLADQVKVARKALQERKSLQAARAETEINAHEASEQRRGVLSHEVATMASNMEELQRRHRAAMQAMQKMAGQHQSRSKNLKQRVGSFKSLDVADAFSLLLPQKMPPPTSGSVHGIIAEEAMGSPDIT